MIAAAIYARKSNDEPGKDTELKSVVRQVEHAKVFAAKRGWMVDDRYVFTDDAVSGAEFTKRGGLQRLLASLEPSPPFQKLIVWELSRLGRDTARTQLLVGEVEESGVEIWAYGNGRQITMQNDAGEVDTVLQSLFAKMERRRASQRTREAMQRLTRRARPRARASSAIAS